MAGFTVSVVTPEKVVVECEARFVALPAHDGELGVLRGRAPLVTRLDVGLLRIEKADGGTEALLIDGGFAEMVHDRLTVLTEDARTPADLDGEDAARHLKEARELTVGDEVSFVARQRALKRARFERRLSSGEKPS